MSKGVPVLEYIALDTGSGKRPFHFRVDSTDKLVFEQVFEHGHYDLRRLARFEDLRSLLLDMKQAGKRPLIIDAGANIGATSVYLAHTFPTARIVAVEPAPDNFALLQRNTAGLDIHCVQAALGAHPGRTRLSDPGFGEWAYRTDPAVEGIEAPVVTVPELLAQFADDAVFLFLVKVDIEGGEQALFAANTDWVAQTPLLTVELHDWMLPKQGTALPFPKCVAGLDRDFVYVGENVFSVDNGVGGGGGGGLKGLLEGKEAGLGDNALVD